MNSTFNGSQRAFLCCLVLSACLFAIAAGTANAGFVTTGEAPIPNLSVMSVTGSYTAEDGMFQCSGSPLDYTGLSSSASELMSEDASNWSLNLTAWLDSGATTPMAASGTITIYGSPTGSAGPGELLLSGEVTAFGSEIAPTLEPNTTFFDCVFTVNGGLYAGDYGASARIIISPEFDSGTPFANSFSSDFTFDGFNGVADVVAVPEPCSGTMLLTLLASGLAATCVSRRFRTRRSV
jgi:hypothetical protein